MVLVLFFFLVLFCISFVLSFMLFRFFFRFLLLFFTFKLISFFIFLFFFYFLFLFLFFIYYYLFFLGGGGIIYFFSKDKNIIIMKIKSVADIGGFLYSSVTLIRFICIFTRFEMTSNSSMKDERRNEITNTNYHAAHRSAMTRTHQISNIHRNAETSSIL